MTNKTEPAADVVEAGNKLAAQARSYSRGFSGTVALGAALNNWHRVSRAALSAMPAPSAGPVVWMITDPRFPDMRPEFSLECDEDCAANCRECGKVVQPLYATPQPTPAQVRAEVLREALEKCRDQFAFYADEHAKAGKHEKAATNAAFRDLAAQALIGDAQ